VPPIEASLLGASLLIEGVENVPGKRLADFTRFTNRQKHLSSHEGLFILKFSRVGLNTQMTNIPSPPSKSPHPLSLMYPDPFFPS